VRRRGRAAGLSHAGRSPAPADRRRLRRITGEPRRASTRRPQPPPFCAAGCASCACSRMPLRSRSPGT
jgi:hypothetical protein